MEKSWSTQLIWIGYESTTLEEEKVSVSTPAEKYLIYSNLLF